MTDTTKKRIDAIDGLRAVAAVSVLFHHIFQQFFDGYKGALPNILLWLGWWGVTLFFLLSGFCIHYPNAVKKINGKNNIDLTMFSKKRLLRIFPAYFVAIAIAIAIGYFFKSNLIGKKVDYIDVISHVFFVHNFFPERVYSINDVFWSIGIEVQFYFLYALLYKKLNFTLKENLLFVAIGLAWYLFSSVYFAQPWRHTLQRIFISTFWMWHLGATMARLFAEGKIKNSKYFWPVLAINLGAAQFDPVILGLHIIYWIAPWFCAILIIESLSLPVNAFLKKIGDSSYSLYLNHPIAIALCIPLGAMYGPIVSIFSALGLAALSYQFIEKPFIHVKNNSPLVT